MTDKIPPFHDEEYWERYVGLQAVMTMGVAISKSQPFLPPEGHATNVQTSHRAIINVHKLTCQYLNIRTRGMSEDDAIDLVEGIVREGIETSKTVTFIVDGSPPIQPIRIYMRQMTSYLSAEAVILDDTLHHPLVANRHFVAHYAVY